MLRSPAARAMPCTGCDDPQLARRGRRDRRLARRGAARPRRRAHRAPARRRAGRRRHDPRRDHAGVGLYPNSRPDPLGDFLETLDRIEELAAARRASRATGAVEDPPARAREISSITASGSTRPRRRSTAEPQSAYEVSLDAVRARTAANAAPLRDGGDARPSGAARASRAGPRAEGTRARPVPIRADEAASDRRSRRAGELPRARGDAARGSAPSRSRCASRSSSTGSTAWSSPAASRRRSCA